MATSFGAATAAWSDTEQQILFSSIPRLIGAVAMADGNTSDEEVTRGIDGLIEVVAELGDEFRYSRYAEAAFDALADSLEVRDPGFSAYLVRLRAVVAKLPEELALRYRSFVMRLCVDIASASRKHILWGQRIDEDEARLLAQIVAELDLEIADPELRDRLGGRPRRARGA